MTPRQGAGPRDPCASMAPQPMQSTPPSPSRPRWPSIAVPWGAAECGASLAALAGLVLVAGVVVGAVLVAADGPDPGISVRTRTMGTLAGTWLLQGGVVAVAYVLGPRRYGLGYAFFGFGQISPRRVAAWALLAVAVNIGFGAMYVAALQRVAPGQVPAPVPEELLVPGFGVTTFVTVAIFSPLSEEVFYRGFLFQGFAMGWGITLGALASAASFAAIHFQGGLGLLPPAFIAGLVFALTFRVTGTIWPGLLAHAVQNGLAFVIAS